MFLKNNKKKSYVIFCKYVYVAKCTTLIEKVILLNYNFHEIVLFQVIVLNINAIICSCGMVLLRRVCVIT